MIFANGDLSSFEITLQREGGGDKARIYTDEQTNILMMLPGETRSRRAHTRAHGATPMNHSPRQRGFTLLEVLIALAIVAMSVGALLGTITSSASNIIYLKDKTLAEWVALNRLTEVRIDQNMPDQGQAQRQHRDGGHALGMGGRSRRASDQGHVPRRGACARHRRTGR